jgi:hypothetical protein
LEQQKKELENEIDNIAALDKRELAKQGSINRMSQGAASLTSSVKVENLVLKEEVSSLHKQVHELNALLESVISEGGVDGEQVAVMRQAAQSSNEETLLKKYRALEKVN